LLRIDLRSQNKNLPAQTELLSKLRDEIRALDTEIMVEEARLGDFKRLSTRNFMTLKLGGLLEFGEKATVSRSVSVLGLDFSHSYIFQIVGELGKLLIEVRLKHLCNFSPTHSVIDHRRSRLNPLRPGSHGHSTRPIQRPKIFQPKCHAALERWSLPLHRK
jgi:hypothetical protein